MRTGHASTGSARGAIRRILAPACAALLAIGCAGANAYDGGAFTPSGRHLTVRVVNESTDIVHVHFVTESGSRVRLATVGPLQSGLFVSSLVAHQPGSFVATRLTADRPSVLPGSADPGMIGSRVVHLTVGPSWEFDRWVLRR